MGLNIVVLRKNKMKNITKIVGLVSVIAIIISVVAISLSINTSNQTNKLNTQLNPTPQPTDTPTPFKLTIYWVYFDNGYQSGNYLTVCANVAPTSIISLKVNGTEEITNTYQSDEFNGQYLALIYPWVSGNTYTFIISTNNETTAYTQNTNAIQ